MKDTTKLNLPNDIILIHRKTTPLPIVSIKLFLKVGVKDESAEKGGIARLTQVLLLKGTRNRSAEEIAVDIESVGGDIGTTATEDYLDISLSVTSKHFERAMDVLSDVFLNPTFPQSEIEKEKYTTIASIKSRKDHIFSVANDTLMEHLYGDHPYGRLPTGTEETVNNITREDIVNWHKEFYGTDNMVMVVVGNVSLYKTKKYIKKYFSNTPAAQKSKLSFEKPVKSKIESLREKSKFKQAYLMFGYLVPQVNSEDYPVLKVLNSYLGSGMSSRLFQKIREEAGLCYEVSSFYPSRLDKSRFVIYMGLDKSNVEKAKNKVLEILNEVKGKPIDDKKLNEVKEYIKGTYLLSHENIEKQAWHLGWWEVLGKGYEYDDKYVPDLNKVTPEDIQKIANKYLQDNYVVLQLIPGK